MHLSFELILIALILFVSLLINCFWFLTYLRYKHQKEKYSRKPGSHPFHDHFKDIKYHIWILKHLPIKLQPKKVRKHPHKPYSLKDNFLILIFHPYFGSLRKAIALWMLFVLILGSLGMYALIKSPPASAANDFSIKTGYYYGRAASFSITGVGFTPEVVIIKSDTAAGSMVWKSSAMPASVTSYLGVATADNTETEITLDEDGFTVSAAAEVNTDSTRYIYIAYAGSDCTSGGVICVGSYIGNGSATQAITTGFQPNLVIAKRSTAVVGNFRTSSMSDNHVGFFSAAANDTTGVYFTTLNSGGFTVGLTNNANASVYYYLAFKNLANKLTVGQFTGDGVDSRNITGLGFEPDFVFVKQNSAVVPAFNTTEMFGDISSVTTAAVNAVNHIQSLDTDGFQVGTSTSVNALGVVSNYFAFGGSPDPQSSGSFFMQKGSYTGNGTGQSIDTSFAPDLVFIKANSTEYGVWSTRPDNNLTHYFGLSAAGFAGGITVMNPTSFTVGTHSTTNTNGITYEWVAYGNATLSSKPARANDFAIGSYTGNGLSPRAIDHLGFAPSMVVIKRAIGTAALSQWSSSSMAANTGAYFSATADSVDGTTVRSLDSGGFTLGTGATVNAVNVTYVWFAFKEGANFDVGSYTGTGVAKNITGLGFDPEYVWTKRSTAVSAVHRSTSSTITTTLSQYFLNSSNITNFITGFVTDGFTVGTATEVNANTGAYQYAAWNSTTSASPPATPTNSAPSNAATAQDLNATLTGSAYSDSDNNAQTDSQWQVDDDSDFATPVWTRTAGASGVTTSITSGNGTFANELSGKTELDHATTYYFRVKYSDGVWSSWSTGTSFTTNTIATPTNSSPASAATVTTLTPTLSTSDFSDAQAGHTAVNAQWQINTTNSFSSPLYDSETVGYGTSHVVPAATLNDRSVYYWRVRYQDSSGLWSAYSTATRFLVSQSGTSISVKPVFGNTVVDQGDSVKIDTQVLSSDGSSIDDATVTLNIYNPSGSKIVTSQSMTYIEDSNGIYRYAYTIPSSNGSYLYDVTATSGSSTGRGAANFEVRTISADLTSAKSTVNTVNTNVNTVNTNLDTVNANVSTVNTNVGTINSSFTTVNSNVATLISEIGTGNISSIKTKTDAISWSDITGIVTSNGQIKAKTDNINWDDVTALKTKTDTINWSDITDIKTKTDTVNWNDVTAIKNATVSITGVVADASPTDSTFKTNLTSSKDNFYKNMVVTFTSGDNAGQSRRVSEYAGSTKKIAVDPAFSYTPENGDAFLISVGSVRAEEIAGSAKSTIESVQSKLNTLSDTVGTNYTGVYNQLVAIAGQLSALGVVQGSGANSLYALSSASQNDISYLKNKILDLQAALEINKAMLSSGSQNSVVSTWYTFHSVVLNMLIANPTDRRTTIPFKAYLPKEAKPENIMTSDGLKIEYEEGAQSYYVTGEFELDGKESVTKKVEIKDIWKHDEEELADFKTQASELYQEAQKTSYSAQALILKNDISNKVSKILRTQKENTQSPEEHIQTFRENQDELASIKTDIKNMTELVTSVGANKGLMASVGGIQTISTWGIVIILITGLAILGAFSYSMWKHQMMVVAALAGNGTSKGASHAAKDIETAETLKDPMHFHFPRFDKYLLSFILKIKWLLVVMILGIAVVVLLRTGIINPKDMNILHMGRVNPTPTSSPLPTPTPKVVEKKVTILETETGWLNVRSEPNTSGAILDKVDVGRSFKELDRSENSAQEEWVAIELDNGEKGWILGRYTEESQDN